MTRKEALFILKLMMESMEDLKKYQALYLATKALETMEYVEGES